MISATSAERHLQFSQPSASLEEKALHKRVKAIWRDCRRRLEEKWPSDPANRWRRPGSKAAGWNYQDAAILLHCQTGCSKQSAERFFHLLEDDLEWIATAGIPDIRDRVLCGVGSLAGIVKLPD